MDELLLGRLGFALSLGFHIIFAALGIGMPLLMVLAEWRYLATKDPTYLILAKRWAKGAAILFAVGAISGTIIAFQIGLLWPGFMKFGGDIIGMPFSLEGFAFFTEAIFLGIYLYGWDKVKPKVHLAAGIGVAFSGCISGIFVVAANSWMNNPAGFEMIDGKPANIDPYAAFFNRGWFQQSLHMTLAAYLSTGAAVAGVHAFMLMRNKESKFHRCALKIALCVSVIAALLQPLSGDVSARHVAQYQPEKLAAMEGHFETEKGAGLSIGGIPFPHPTEREGEMRYAIKIPYMLSILAFHDPHAEVKGLKDFPRDEWPNPVICHLAFQVMVGCGSALAGLAALTIFLWWRKKLDNLWYLRAVAACTPLGFIALEAGWTVTEVGRQPWVVYKIVKTADALTPVKGLIIPFVTFLLIYIFLAVVVVALLKRQISISDGPDAMDKIRRDEREEASHHASP